MTNCPICDSSSDKVILRNCIDLEYGYQGKFDLVCCRGCGIYRLEPLPTVEQLIDAYPLIYHGFTYSEKKSVVYNLLSALRIKSKAALYKDIIGKAGRILDVGCADGYFIEQLRSYGEWEFTGLDFKHEAVEKGRRRGINILEGTFSSLPFKDNYFDLLIMNHILEHVQNPLEDLLKARRILRAKGYIAGEIPNIASFDFMIFKRYWGGLHVPRHTFHYTPQNFCSLVQRAGLELIELKFELNTTHWALSVQNLLQKNISDKRNSQHLKFGRADYYNVLLFAFIPINFIAKILNRTGVMSFVIRKP